MNDKYRGIFDLVGLFVVAASLVFVAFQMQQDRIIAQAALNSSQLENYAARLTAGLESDAYLSMWGKRCMALKRGTQPGYLKTK